VTTLKVGVAGEKKAKELSALDQLAAKRRDRRATPAG